MLLLFKFIFLSYCFYNKNKLETFKNTQLLVQFKVGFSYIAGINKHSRELLTMKAILDIKLIILIDPVVNILEFYAKNILLRVGKSTN